MKSLHLAIAHVALGFGITPANAQQVTATNQPLRIEQSFEATKTSAPGAESDNLDQWKGEGEAEFTFDDTEKQSGQRSARIVVRPGNALQWPKWTRRFGAVSPGDEFHAVVWVRTQNVVQGSGAYMALQFLSTQGQRVGIEHSPINLSNGQNGWQKLELKAVAPRGSTQGQIHLVFNSTGTAWFDDISLVRTGHRAPLSDLGKAMRLLNIHPDKTVQARFGGVGYHSFHHDQPMSERVMNEVVYKRWRELNPSFVRLNHHNSWSLEKQEAVVEHFRHFQKTGTELYLATWDPRDATTDAEYRDYARQVVDDLEYYVRTKGLNNLKYYCMSNELSLNKWGALVNDLPKFKTYHRALFDELRARRLPIGLLATDASPVGYWSTIEWATQNMDDITAVYGGHNYFNDHPPDDVQFYDWWLDKLKWATGIARAKNKEFILGEFGSKQDGRTIDGKMMDACVYWDTPLEPQVGLQISESAIASLNAGVQALGYWTFMDAPDTLSKTYANKWGLFKWRNLPTGNDFSTRAPYYAFGLMSKYFRGPSRVVQVETNDAYLRAAAVQHAGVTWSIAVVNRYHNAVPLKLNLPVKNTRFRKFVYDAAKVTHHPFGDLPAPEKTLTLKSGSVADSIKANSLTVYTSQFDEKAPAPVSQLQMHTVDGKRKLTWAANTENDFCYYRIYRSNSKEFRLTTDRQIGTTIVNEFEDEKASAQMPFYAVVPVDQSGNAGRATVVDAPRFEMTTQSRQALNPTTTW
jgi:hypothetical protein